MQAEVNNAWITLDEKKKGTTPENGITVQRASKSLNAVWGKPDANGKSIVTSCLLSYYERELYPNGDVIKESEKNYVLENLARQDVGETKEMLPLAVLDGFIAALGQAQIVDKINATLADTSKLPIDVENNYQLHRDTREVVDKPIITE